MLIRKAEAIDIEDIRQISLDLTIDRNTDADSGFLEYNTPDFDVMGLRVTGGIFYVAGLPAIGFVSAYTDGMLRNPHWKFDNDEIIQHLLKKPGNFAYVDQVGVRDEFRGQNVAKELVQKCLEHAYLLNEYRTFCASPYLKPKRSEAGIHLIESEGFEFEEEITVYDGLVFGIYKMEMPQSRRVGRR